MEQLWWQRVEGSDDQPCIYSLVHHSHPSGSEPYQHCQTLIRKKKWSAKLNFCNFFLFFPPFFLFSGENPWMADVHPNPLNNRKCSRSGGGGGDCYCLLDGVLLQWLVRGSMFSGQEKSGLSMGCGSAWNSTSRSGTAFATKPLQILTKEPKLVMEGKFGSLQHNIRQTGSR